MGFVESTCKTHWDSDHVVLHKIAREWAFDNNFDMEEEFSGGIRLTRSRAKLAFLYALNVLDYPITIAIRHDEKTKRVNIHVSANLSGTLLILIQDRNKINKMAQEICEIIRTRSHSYFQDVDGEQTDDYVSGSDSNEMTRSTALRELGLSEQETSWSKIEESYRRLARQYHPDTYASQNLPPEMIDAAVERFQRITAAWEFLRANR
jgi:DnaJ-like protein